MLRFTHMTSFAKSRAALLALLLIAAPLALPAKAASPEETAKATIIQPTPSEKKDRIEVAFVLDTTGSMAELIDGAKKKIWSIANVIVDDNPEAEILFGLVGYRDIGDEYVTKNFPLTTDVQHIYAELLKFKADGGGDTPESVNEALDVAVGKLGWTAQKENGQNAPQGKVKRVLFLVGDAPPHMDYEQDRKYPEVIRDAVSKGIIVNTVQAGNMGSTTKIWKEMAKLGKGSYHAIPQSGGKVIVIVTPYDEDIRRIQIDLNKTVIAYGTAKEQSAVRSKAALAEAAPAAAAADMSSYIVKEGKGRKVVSDEKDLSYLYTKDPKKILEIPKDKLPKELQKLSETELKDFVAKKTAEREALSAKLSELVVKRDEYIRQEEAKKTEEKKTDSFDRSVSDTLKRQLK